MGNEFGHPEWIDFPREGNNWSYQYARRQWPLLDNPLLRYHFLADFDRDMLSLIKGANLLGTLYANLMNCDENNKCLIFERAGLVFLFNFHQDASIPGYEFTVNEPGEYRIVLNSDNVRYGGQGRIDEEMLYYTRLDESSQVPRLSVYFTSRTAMVLKKIENTQ